MRPRTGFSTRITALTVLVTALALGACGDDDPGINEAGSPNEGASATTTSSAAPDPMQEPAREAGEADPASVTCEAGNGGGGGDEDVAITGFTFDPGDLEIEPGESVTFSNQDPADHSVWSAERIDGDPAFESVGSDPEFRLPEVLHSGDSSTCTFPTAGTYEYLCGVHNSMRGTVTVA